MLPLLTRNIKFDILVCFYATTPKVVQLFSANGIVKFCQCLYASISSVFPVLNAINLLIQHQIKLVNYDELVKRRKINNFQATS